MGPPMVPRPEQHKGIGGTIKQYFKEMAPLGIGDEFKKERQQSEAQQQYEWQLKQQDALGDYQRNEVMQEQLMKEQMQRTMRLQNVQRMANYFLPQFGGDTFKAMEYANQLVNAQKLPDMTQDMETVDVMAGDQYFSALQDKKTGQLFVGNPNGNGMAPFPWQQGMRVLPKGWNPPAGRTVAGTHYQDIEIIDPKAPGGHRTAVFDPMGPAVYDIDTGKPIPNAQRYYVPPQPPGFQFIPTDNGIFPVSKTGQVGNALTVPGTGEPLTKTPQAAREKTLLVQEMIKDAGDLRALATDNLGSIGALQGHWSAAKRMTVGESPEVNEMFRIADNMADKLLRARSGASINEEEYKRLRALVPNPRWAESKFFSDLDGFEKELKNTLARREKEYGAQRNTADKVTFTGSDGKDHTILKSDLPEAQRRDPGLKVK
jgi:hypothetical protein